MLQLVTSEMIYRARPGAMPLVRMLRALRMLCCLVLEFGRSGRSAILRAAQPCLFVYKSEEGGAFVRARHGSA